MGGNMGNGVIAFWDRLTAIDWRNLMGGETLKIPSTRQDLFWGGGRRGGLEIRLNARPGGNMGNGEEVGR